MADLTWHTPDLADADTVAAVRELAAACLETDGGLPMLLDDGLLRARLGGDATTGATDADGRLVAAAAVRTDDDGATTSGLVHPDLRGRGLGTRLMEWATTEAAGRPLVVQTECSSPAAERLYVKQGLSQSFAELVMRHDLADVPHVEPVGDVTVVPVAELDDDGLGDLFAAYAGSFADRPGFADPTQEEWLEDLVDDDEWDRDLSAVAYDGGVPVAFVNIVENWVDQVGVVPSHRGRRLGAALTSRALATLAERGADGAWLTVEIANPAAHLYRRLGFTEHGKRARFS
jgi:mycothiol synthase